MKIVIVGAGKVGCGLIEALVNEGHDIVLIDKREERLSEMLERFQIMGVLGDGSLNQVQREAGVETADIFIACTVYDEVNLIASVIAKKLGAKRTVARVRTPGFANQSGFLRDSLGITRIMNPELEAAQEIYKIVRYPSALSLEPFAVGRVNLVELPVDEDSPLCNLKMSEFRKKYVDVIVCIIRRGNETLIPMGDTVIMSNDRVFVTGRSDSVEKLYREVGKVDRVKSLLLIGGGRISRYLLDFLKTQKNMFIKVIERDEAVVNELANENEHISIIKGDGTNHALLESENIESFDCVATLTGIDEENIILSLFASSKNVLRTITKVNRTSLLPVVASIPLQSIITPAEIAVTRMIRWIRAIGNSEGSKVEALYRLGGNRAEVLQFVVSSQSRLIRQEIKELNFKRNILIAAIIRGDKVIVPSGDDYFLENDHAIVVSIENEFDDLEDILV